MKKKVIFLVLFLVLLIASIWFFLNLDNIFFKPMIIDNVIKVEVTVDCLFDNNISVTIEDSDSIKIVIDIESVIKKNSGTNFLIKAKPWYIEIKYYLNNGDTVERKYKGQRALVELQSEFIKIPQIEKPVSK